MVEEKNIPTQNFIKYFKEEHSKNIDLFISKYISVIPEDLREILFRVEDTLQGNYFVTGLDYNMSFDTSNAKFHSESYSLIYKELGEDIYHLLTYFEGIEGVETPKKLKGGLFYLCTAENFLMTLLYLMLVYVIIQIGLVKS